VNSIYLSLLKEAEQRRDFLKLIYENSEQILSFAKSIIPINESQQISSGVGAALNALLGCQWFEAASPFGIFELSDNRWSGVCPICGSKEVYVTDTQDDDVYPIEWCVCKDCHVDFELCVEEDKQPYLTEVQRWFMPRTDCNWKKRPKTKTYYQWYISQKINKETT
jgi:hypothetical protein